MKILFVAPSSPFPPTNGARLVVAQLARQLSQKHTLYFAGLVGGSETDPELSEHFAAVKLVRRHELPRWRRMLVTLFDPLPLWVRLSVSAPFRTALREMVGTHAIDVVHLDMGQMVPYADAVAPLPTVLAPHDSLTRLLAQRVTGAATTWARTAARLQYQKMKRFEATQYAAAHRVVVVTESERDYLHLLAPALPVRVVPNGIDPHYFAPMPQVAVEPHSIGVHGVMDHPENSDAVLTFAQNVLPRIRRYIPDAKFTVIGKRPPPTIRALAEPGRLHVTGEVDDVRPYLAAQTLIVVPTRLAGGIKNKLLEALAMGKPLVATPEAIEGTTVCDGQELLLARGADEFAAACVRLLRDADERARLGANARTWALAHTWKMAADQYLAVYQEAIDAAAHR